jgi:hypothetical protein
MLELHPGAAPWCEVHLPDHAEDVNAVAGLGRVRISDEKVSVSEFDNRRRAEV